MLHILFSSRQKNSKSTRISSFLNTQRRQRLLLLVAFYALFLFLVYVVLIPNSFVLATSIEPSSTSCSNNNNISRNPITMSTPATSIETQHCTTKEKVCIIGSGNWASAISIIIGNNCKRLDFCHSDVYMYVYDEIITLQQGGGQDKLSNIMNTQHENIKYLPNIKLPVNIIAIPDLTKAIEGATILIFCLPHQFLTPILKTIQKNTHLLHPNGCRGVSLIKGMDYDPKDKVPVLISKTIEDTINNNNYHYHDNNDKNFSCGVLMGANVANGVAKQQICESTLATNFKSSRLNEQTKQIFHNEQYFRVQHTTDIYGTEACGALKNIVALGCGFIDSMYDKDKVDEGSNTKAALIRIGLLEMKRFCQLFLDGVKDDTFNESCGIADLITTCYSGRNYKCAKEFGYRQQQQLHPNTNKWNEKKCRDEWSMIEKSLLNGQKLQGTPTCEEVYMILSSRNLLQSFPLFHVIYEIAFQGRPINQIVDGIHVVNIDNDGIDLRSRL